MDTQSSKPMNAILSDCEAESSSLSAGEILQLAQEGKPIPPARALATYADPKNWVQLYDIRAASGEYTPRACEWAFIGPMRPGYELARCALRTAREKGQRP